MMPTRGADGLVHPGVLDHVGEIPARGLLRAQLDADAAGLVAQALADLRISGLEARMTAAERDAQLLKDRVTRLEQAVAQLRGELADVRKMVTRLDEDAVSRRQWRKIIRDRDRAHRVSTMMVATDTTMRESLARDFKPSIHGFRFANRFAGYVPPLDAFNSDMGSLRHFR